MHNILDYSFGKGLYLIINAVLWFIHCDCLDEETHAVTETHTETHTEAHIETEKEEIEEVDLSMEKESEVPADKNTHGTHFF